MKKLKKISSNENPQYEAYSFFCPGCDHPHVYYVKGESLSWEFNGDMDRPTFWPSLLNHLPGKPNEERCHLHLTDGILRFERDCSHALAGQNVPLV